MKGLRLFKKNSLVKVKKEAYEIREYCTMDYERVKSKAATTLIVELLKNINDALIEQPFLEDDISLLVEKVYQQIDVRGIVAYNKCSYQMLNYQYLDVLGTNGLWQMLQEKFIDIQLNVTEDVFRKVTTFLMPYFKELSKKEKAYLEQIARNCVSVRADGRIEIIFTAEMWGNEEMVEATKKRAEKAGICFVDVPCSPISRKAILPLGWKVFNLMNDEYTYICDETNTTRGVFRIKELPNKHNNGEFNFFFDIPKLRNKNFTHRIKTQQVAKRRIETTNKKLITQK